MFTFFSITLFTYSYGQNDSLHHQKFPFMWINFGLGSASVINDASHPALSNASIDLVSKKNIFSIGTPDYSNLVFWGGGGERRTEYSILYGRYIALDKHTFISISSGLSLVNIVYSDSIGISTTGSNGSWFTWPITIYKNRSVYYVGLSLKAQAIIHCKFAGIGLAAFANINRQRSYVGGAINISVGKIKR